MGETSWMNFDIGFGCRSCYSFVRTQDTAACKDYFVLPDEPISLDGCESVASDYTKLEMTAYDPVLW